jgi:uroporphyrinogen decarboxylase
LSTVLLRRRRFQPDDSGDVRDFRLSILRRVFEFIAPDPDDKRYQHSDSAMGHLVPILGRLDLNGVNFGPTVTVSHSRITSPRRIDGQLSPLTFMRNDTEGIIVQVRRDCDQARENDARGVNIMTAGSDQQRFASLLHAHGHGRDPKLRQI